MTPFDTSNASHANSGFGGMDFAVRIPIMTYGVENLDRIKNEIAKTTEQVRISTDFWNRWQASMVRSSDAGYTLKESMDIARKSVANISNDMNAFTGRLKENILEQQKLETQSGRTGAVLGRIAGRIGGAEILGQGLGVPGGGFIGSQLFQSLGISGGAGYAAGGVALGATALYGVVKAAESTAKYAQEQKNLSAELGITTTQSQLLGRVTEVTGTQTNTMFQALRSMNRELTESGPKSAQVKKALSDMGLTVGIAFKQPYDQLMDILDALKKLDQVGRERSAINLLGESAGSSGFSGRQLLAMVDDHREITKAIQGTGVIINPDDVTRMEKLARESALVKEAWGGIAHNIGIFADELFTLGSKNLLKFITPEVGPTPSYLKGTRFDRELYPDGPFGGKATPKVDMERYRKEVETQAMVRGDYRMSQEKELRQYGMTPLEKLQDNRKELLKEGASAMKDYFAGTGTKTAVYQARDREAAAERGIKQEEERVRQEHTFSELRPLAEMNYSEMATELAGFNQKFSLILGSPAVRSRAATLQQGARIAQDQELSKIKTDRNHDFSRLQAYTYHHDISDLVRDSNEVVSDQMKGVSDSDKVSRGEEAEGLKKAKFQQLIQGSYSKYGLNPMEIARKELQLFLGQTDTEDTVKGVRLGREITSRQNAHEGLLGVWGERAEDARARLKAELEEKGLDVKAAENDLLVKAAEHIIKFNSAVDSANEAMRNQFAGGFESVIMGAQKGGGKGVLGALRGFAEGQEATILKNIGGAIYGQGGPIHAKAGTTLDKILTGTIFGSVGNRLDPAKDLKEAASDLKDAARALKGTGQGSGSGTSVTVGGSGTLDLGSGTPGTIGGNSDGTAGTIGEIGTLASVASGLSGVTGGSTSQSLKVVASTLGKLDSIMKGVKYTGNIPKILSGTLSAGQETGAILGTVAAGIGVYEGISTAAKGGAKNVSGGIAGALGAAAPFTGPAAPYVATAAALAGLVSSFLPDMRQYRGAEISKELFGQRYLAPMAWNLSESSNGGYSDVDASGNVRISHFSPFPVLSNSYQDVPRRTIVPGHTISTFGGFNGTPSAGVYQSTPRANGNVNAPTYNLHVHAMDAKSIIDHADTLTDAVHRGLQNSGHPLVHLLAGQMGLRG